MNKEKPPPILRGDPNGKPKSTSRKERAKRGRPRKEPKHTGGNGSSAISGKADVPEAVVEYAVIRETPEACQQYPDGDATMTEEQEREVEAGASNFIGKKRLGRPPKEKKSKQLERGQKTVDFLKWKESVSMKASPARSSGESPRSGAFGSSSAPLDLTADGGSSSQASSSALTGQASSTRSSHDSNTTTATTSGSSSPRIELTAAGR